MKQLRLEQLITSPTRITNLSNTVIDHIWCNNSELYAYRGVIDTGLSDHSLIFCARKKAKISREKQIIEIRSRRHFDELAFAKDVADIDWTPVLTEPDIDTATCLFQLLFMDIVNKHMPVKRIRARIKQAPWVSSEFLSLIDNREHKARQVRKSPSEENIANLKVAKKQVQQLKRALKRTYIETQLSRHGNDPKKLWRTIRTFWPSTKSSHNHICNINNLTNNSDIANEMNTFFCETGKRIQSNIMTNATLDDFPYPHQPPTFEFKEIADEDIANAINLLSSSPSSSIDDITALMIKSAKTELIKILKFLFNLSINKRKFPACWKVSKVTPLFKAGNASDVNNYRPISIIPTVGKLFERIIHTQSSTYLKNYDLLTDSQSGFRPGHSTGTALMEFLDHIYRGIDEGGAGGALFVDLSKAFDSIDHTIMIDKLKKLGFRQSALTWFDSYLSNRYQITKVNNTLSNPMLNECGVPQGSILGPLLFICYINDLPQHLSHTSVSIYADDTAILSIGNDLAEIETRIQNDMTTLSAWFDANKLNLNKSKSKTMLFTSNRNRLKDCNLNITVNGTALEPVKTFKYLGVELDATLSFESHINRVCAKVSQRTGLLWRIRSFINTSLAKDIYTSLIEPHFLYLDYIYDGCSKASSDRLQITQNNALRAVLRAEPRYPTTELHEKTGVNWLNFQRKKSTCIQVYKSLNGLNPPRLNSMFTIKAPPRSLRSNNKIILIKPITKLKVSDHNIRIRGIRYWEELDEETQKSETLNQFKARI